MSLSVLSNYVFGCSNFDTAFFPDCTKFCIVFLGYWIENLMRISKMCHFFIPSGFDTILSLTVTLCKNQSLENFFLQYSIQNVFLRFMTVF